MEIYLDNSATTRVFPEVAEVMTRVMCEDYGNPSSLHMKGVQAEQYLRNAKETFARILKVNEKEIFFTSGGTESDNMALIGCARAGVRQGKHLITSKIEHSCFIFFIFFIFPLSAQLFVFKAILAYQVCGCRTDTNLSCCCNSLHFFYPFTDPIVIP